MSGNLALSSDWLMDLLPSVPVLTFYVAIGSYGSVDIRFSLVGQIPKSTLQK